MTVCRFFQQGYCRYGQNCRYDHIYGSKYSYHANPPQQTAPSQPATSTDEQLVNQVQTDVQSVLRGGQWILSCYSPFKERPAFPGICDLSPEEARLFIYEAKSRNNLEQAITYMNNLFQDTKQKYEQLLHPNTNIIKVLRGLYKGEIPPSPFTNTELNTFGAANNTASSIFRSAVQNTQQATQNVNVAASVFSQGQNSIFNTHPDPAKELFSNANNANFFGSSPPNVLGAVNQVSSAKSLFASAVQNTSNQTNPSNIFAAANQSIFGSPPSQNTNSPFGQTQINSPFNQAQSNSPFNQAQSNSPFNQTQSNSPFATGQNTSPFSQGNVFQKTESPASIFGQANKQLTASNDPGVYSKMEELSEADLEAFRSDKFELGLVPEMPPPYQLCSPAL